MDVFVLMLVGAVVFVFLVGWLAWLISKPIINFIVAPLEEDE